MFHPKYTSFLICLNIIHSLCNELYIMTILQFFVLTTSIIYHHNLIPNFRNFDILISNSVILYHFYLYSYYISFEYYNLVPCIFYILAIGSYIAGRLYNDDIYHGYLHIYGVIANIMLNNCLVYNIFL
jgi:hypothetical protein